MAPMFAASKIATTEDGTVVILNTDNNTYKVFTQKTYDKPTGFTVKDPSKVDYLGKSWSSITLAAMGNYLPSHSAFYRGTYSTGEFYLLDMKTTVNANLPISTADYSIPTLNLKDGTSVKGTNERLSAVREHSSLGWYTDSVTKQQLEYTVIYEVPLNATPVSFTYTDSNGQNPKIISLGSKGTLSE
jgi:hypothetical protein